MRAGDFTVLHLRQILESMAVEEQEEMKAEFEAVAQRYQNLPRAEAVELRRRDVWAVLLKNIKRFAGCSGKVN